jgi:transposase
MSGYSVDLRERALAARQEGKTQAWIAATFKISVSRVKRYIERFEQTGTGAATQQSRQQPIIHEGYRGAIDALVQRLAVATLEEYCEAWARESGQSVSIQTMSRTLSRFGWPRTKSQLARLSAMR